MGRLLPPRSKISQESQETLHHEVKPACEHGVLVMEGKQLIQDKIAKIVETGGECGEFGLQYKFECVAVCAFEILGLDRDLVHGRAIEPFDGDVHGLLEAHSVEDASAVEDGEDVAHIDVELFPAPLSEGEDEPLIPGDAARQKDKVTHAEFLLDMAPQHLERHVPSELGDDGFAEGVQGSPLNDGHVVEKVIARVLGER